MSAAAIEAELAKRPGALQPEHPVELDLDDEGRAAALFLDLETNWNWTVTGMVSGNGGVPMRTGLRYEAIPVAAGARGIALDSQVFTDLRAMEAEALKTFAEQRR